MSKLFQTTLEGNDWEMCGITKTGHSESFQTTLVEKDGKKCKVIRIWHP